VTLIGQESSFQLAAFCDQSQTAHCAVIYANTTHEDLS